MRELTWEEALELMFMSHRVELVERYGIQAVLAAERRGEETARLILFGDPEAPEPRGILNAATVEPSSWSAHVDAIGR